MKSRAWIIFIVFGAIFFLTVNYVLADLSYNPYDSDPKYPEAYNQEHVKKQNDKRNLLNLPFLPFRALDWGVEQTLNWAENTHFPTKVKWLWEDVLHENGIYPEARFSPTTWGFGAGGSLHMEKLTRSEYLFPFFKWHGKGGATIKGDADVGASYEFFQSDGWRFYHKGIFDFTHKENENFYGLGPRSSRGDGYSYEINTTLLEARAGFYPHRTIDIGGSFTYRHVTVNDGDVNGAGNINNFTIGQLPGLDGGKIITLKSFVEHDTRDFPGDPTKGGLRRFTFSFNRDTRHDDNYFKYYVELTQYFQLWSERRVLLLHFTGEHVKTVNHSSVPFFDLARLGGYGTQPAGSTTLRGYKYNRFFDRSSAALNIEYRYNVWQYGNFGGDWVFFCDLGKVFGDFHEFGIGKVKVSYGTGIRLKAHRRVFFSAQIAHSSEGTEFYFKTKTPF